MNEKSSAGKLFRRHGLPQKESGETLVPATRHRLRTWLVLLTLAAILAVLCVLEARSSFVQSHLASREASRITFALGAGPSDSILYPEGGPFDDRRGFSHLGAITDTLLARGYRIESQVRFSPAMMTWVRRGVFAPYAERPQAGLRILDRRDLPLYSVTFPERIYANFDSIPEFIVRSLLFIENRELLDPGRPNMNPAVEWDRLLRATLDQVLAALGRAGDTPGGSTLATQIEKYRHSPEGRTADPKDKILQMTSATLRAYRNGRNTEEARRNIVLTFVNSVPLAAVSGFGEVNGLGDGLHAWYGADFDRVNRHLAGLGKPASSPEELLEQARAVKMVLSLFVAHRRPSAYLTGSRQAIRDDTDSYLRLLGRAGFLSPEVRDAALPLELNLRRGVLPPPPAPYAERKAANAIRVRLLSLTGVNDLYALDRVDLTAETTLERDAQKTLSQRLQRLKDKAFTDSLGFNAARMLDRGNPADVVYSFTLYESTPRGNLVRVQADNLDQPLDINEGAKLDLGSTAKLRTLVTYLEIVSNLHARHAGSTRGELRNVKVDRSDVIRRWAVDFLSYAPDTTLQAMLDAAMNRTYSSSTGEGFFTGGGLHHFVNFNKADNGRVMTVSEAMRHSVNLVFIRLMRDVARFYNAENPNFTSDLFEQRDHPLREEYLRRFADQEGRVFMARFYPRYKDKTPEEALQKVVESIRPTPKRLAVLFRSIRPDASDHEFKAFVYRVLPNDNTPERVLDDLYERYAKDAFNLADRGYLSRVHPLELWLLDYLLVHPGASWSEVIAASAQARQDVYEWLFRTRYLEAQNRRIRNILEEEAFEKIHRSWVRQGYPFSSLVPSYATSIGSSADRPASLAELVGIIVNDGIRLPAGRIETLHFAAGTPYETTFQRVPRDGTRVYPPELARTVRRALVDVVENGTARRGLGMFKRADGKIIAVGGKTGTGDHRFETYGRGGHLIESRVVARTATFVFLIGDRFFGTLTAFVKGPNAGNYGFTSSLPVEILKQLAPGLTPMVLEADSLAALAEAAASPAPARRAAASSGSAGADSLNPAAVPDSGDSSRPATVPAVADSSLETPDGRAGNEGF